VFMPRSSAATKAPDPAESIELPDSIQLPIGVDLGGEDFDESLPLSLILQRILAQLETHSELLGRIVDATETMADVLTFDGPAPS
jgi:hypothetical protein